MKIAIPLADGILTEHFGHCQEFAIVEVDTDENKILHNQRLKPPQHEPGVLPRWLGENGVDLILAGGMGGRAKQLFDAQGIRVLVGIPPKAPKELISRYFEGTLIAGDNACDHG
jgi:ATP-binding protein involved in chromosome partitioning